MPSAVPKGEPAPLAPDSHDFLVSLFEELLSKFPPESEKLARDSRIYEGLLKGLKGAGLPGDEATRERVIEIAAEQGQYYRLIEAEYRQAALEHRAFAELLRALGEGWALVPKPNPRFR